MKTDGNLIFIASDHAGFELKNHLLEYLKREFSGFKFEDLGSFDKSSVSYPDYAKKVAENVASGKGNTLFLQLLINGLKLQPCNPSFIQARNAFIEADHLHHRGENKCLIWKAFAKRGLGEDAKADLKNSFKVPTGC